MRPLDIQQIGNELAIKWEDGTESFLPLRTLREHCPCAGCKGEVDIMGNLYKNPDRPLSEKAFQLVSLQRVGGYALQPPGRTATRRGCTRLIIWKGCPKPHKKNRTNQFDSSGGNRR